jgi:protein-L-isoaspartate(D-aspartate) O-methyltransferase
MFWNKPSTTLSPEYARLQMLDEQLRRRGITSRRVLDAMGRIERERFMSPELRDLAYADQAAAIDCGQTISQPYIVALMTQAAELSGHEHVLEIGTGSGYQTAILAELCGDVITVERHGELSRQAAEVIHDLGYQNVTFIIGDGAQGYSELAPYDRIVVTAAAAEIPAALFDQLREGGLMIIPIGDADSQMLQAIRKLNGQPVAEDLCSCRFVPFVGAQPSE